MAKPGGKARGKNKPPPGPQPKADDDDSSSNELSLKLRRGSSDSRDSFYMDFDQGIDSDIEQVSSTATAATVTGGLVGATTAGLVVVVGAELEAAVVQASVASTSSPIRVPSRPTSSAIKPRYVYALVLPFTTVKSVSHEP
ncbi:hypothetical protein B566_EDAN007128 [Ephemera danica]|nr:hypothetical protein B566_EDAN007128 [Ephemera danica]